MLDAKKALELAQDNYATWGQYVVETTTLEELQEQLEDFDTLEQWVEVRERVADAYREIEKMY